MPPKKDVAAKKAAGVRKHRKIIRDSIQGITKGGLRRLMITAAHNSGVSSISAKAPKGSKKKSIRMTTHCYDELRSLCKSIIEGLAKNTAVAVESAGRKTVLKKDIAFAAESLGKKYYFPQDDLPTVRNVDDLKKELKKDGFFCLPKASLTRFLHEVFQDVSPVDGLRYSKGAILWARFYVENEMIKILSRAITNMVNVSSRTTLEPKDIINARNTIC